MMFANAELAESIFAGLSERPVWQTFLQKLSKRLGGSGSAIIFSVSGKNLDQGAVLAPIGMDAPFSALVGSSLLDTLPFEQPAMLQATDDASRPWRGSVAIRIRLDERRSIWVVTRAPLDEGSIAADWFEVLADLQPLLSGITKPYLALARSERRRLIAEYVLETSGAGVILVDEHGVVLNTNAVADAMLAETQQLGLFDGKIVAHRQAEQQLLKDHIRTMAHHQSPNSRPDCYATLALSRDDHLIPVTAIIRPGPPYAPISAPLRRTAVIVLRDPARQNPLDAIDIEHLFKLTKAEAKLARLLAAGMNTEEAAIQLSVSKHTVRSQLQSIFTKTGTNRQTELVRLLLSSSANLAQTGTKE